MSNYYFSAGTAIFLTLLAAAMWGSWMQVIKYRKDYPLSAVAFLLYGFSFILIWVVTLLLAPTLLPEGIIATSAANASAIPTILLGGGMMSLGMLISLIVMGEVGLLLYTAVSGALGSLLGIVTSVAEEGLPNGPNSLILLILCTVIFILASFVSNYAAVMRDRDRSAAEGQKSGKKKSSVTFKTLFLLILSTVLVNGWSVGTAAGTARGVPPILTCAYMATGSFLSLLVGCGIYYTVKKQWKTVFCIGASKKPILLSIIGSVCHYGGNLISIYSMPVISATLSFLFGRTANVWTCFWGFYYHEFAGAKRKTLAVLFIGIFLYFLGIVLLSLFHYS